MIHAPILHMLCRGGYRCPQADGTEWCVEWNVLMVLPRALLKGELAAVG